MLVFISDLHITNRTTGVQNLEASAFEEAFFNLARQANQAKSAEITFVFLGDVFDLVRTTYWFKGLETDDAPNQGEISRSDGQSEDKVPPEQRPWGLAPENLALVEKRAIELMQDILDKNKEIFKIWNGTGPDFRTRFNFPHEPKRVYIPGNHDRIVNQFPSLRKMAIKALGLNVGVTSEKHLSGNQPFKYFYHHPDYRVFARHGQEWDAYNFEHVADWNKRIARGRPAQIVAPDDDYLEIPIGELIAAEVASRLPEAVRAKLGNSIPPEDQTLIVEHMKTIDDVHPISAILPWLIESLRTQAAMKRHPVAVANALTQAIQAVISGFTGLPYTQEWMKKHDSASPVDYVDQLQGAIKGLQSLRIETISGILQMLDTAPFAALKAVASLIPSVAKATENDNYATQAKADLETICNHVPYKDTLYILYGHTHRADQVPIDTPKDSLCQVYLNTGTWRPLYRQAIAQRGFIRWNNMTFTIFYNGDHDPKSQAAGGDPTFETWTGSLLQPLQKSSRPVHHGMQVLAKQD